MKHIVALTGAGISAESGIKTFRDANGLWEGYDIMEIASPMGWKNNPNKVLEFYNKRRQQLQTVKPNPAHYALVELENKYKVSIVTQNVDDLYERAGSSNVIHLHGELLKVRSTLNEDLVLEWKEDLKIGDCCENNFQLRPHVVWFGEAVPMFSQAIEITETADILLIIGTSMQVYPAAALMDFVKPGTKIYLIDPKPAIDSHSNLTIIKEKAAIGVTELARNLMK